VTEAPALAPGWDGHVHVFDATAPVAPGHYQPGEHRLAEIEALAAREGIGHLLLVQPSVYGSDNSVLLHALAGSGARHRGVVVLDTSVTPDELARMHALGVRGVRFNLVSPVGNAAAPAVTLARLAPQLRQRGWFVQWYVRHAQLPELVALQASCGLVFVLDHLAGLAAGLADDAPAWAAAAALARAGAWLKLSGWYRLNASAPFAELDATIARVHRLFGPRLLWGSDWPHTGLGVNERPRYAACLAPLRRVLDAPTQRWMLEEGASRLLD
jgi:predicted TIM-barrel fold metal-dependent hydrolase